MFIAVFDCGRCENALLLAEKAFGALRAIVLEKIRDTGPSGRATLPQASLADT
jgi:hypothetical protein